MRLNFTKKLFAGLFLTMFVPLTATAQERIWINATNFPDENFRDYLKNLTYGQDGILTADEIEKIKSIYVYRQNISSLKGIEFFTNLTTLSCYANKLTELDVSKKTELKELDCEYNQLTALDLSNTPQLASIICRNNQLRYLTLDGCDFTTLYCYNNKINEEFVYYAFAGISYSNNAGTTRTIYFKYGADDENSYPNKTFNYGTINTTMFQWYDNGWKDYSGSGRQIPTVSVSVGEDGIATYCPIAPVNFGNAKNIAAYRASIEDNTVKLTRVTGYVRKGEGVLLRSLNGGAATENLPLVTSNLGGYKNSFVGVVDNGIRKEVIVPEKEEDSNVTNFVLSKKNGVIGFYKAKPEGTKVALGKAYLPVENYDETAAEAGLRIVFDDATAIDNVEVQQETEDDAIYTLSGVRVTNPTQKGIYIRNGKKVIIK